MVTHTAAVLLALAGTTPAGAAAETALSHQAPTIGASFSAFWTSARDCPFEAQEALWDKLIEGPRHDLYASVVWEIKDHAGWKEKKEQLLRKRFLEYPGLSNEIPSAAGLLQTDIAAQTVRFRGLFPDAPARPSIELVLAPNFDAKSGVTGNGTPVLVFAVDSLILERADMSIIFPHELFHLYQARHAGIQNDGVMPDADLTLPLFAEGLATFVSSLVSPGHSDGQLLLQNSLGAIPDVRLQDVAARFLLDANEKAIDSAHPEAFARWFMGSSRDYQTDLPNRAGYWLGLHIVRQMRRDHSLLEMASWSPLRAQTETRSALLQLAHGK